MGVFTDTDSATILDTVISTLENACGTLPDGDERRVFGETLSMLFVSVFNTIDDVAKQKMLKWARGEVLDAIGDGYATRMDAVKATTTLRFGIGEAYGSDIDIPAGVRASTVAGEIFLTTEDATLATGELYVDVQAEAEEGGEEYNNILTELINIIVDKSTIPLIDTVKNITVTDGGDDGEPDDDVGNERFRKRIRLAMSAQNTCGSAEAYRFYALSTDASIADVYVGIESAGVVLIKAILEGGELPDDDMNEAIYNVCAADDVRPLTDTVKIETPAQVSYDIDLTYYVDEDKESEVATAIEDGLLDEFVEEQDTAFGSAINPDKLTYMLMMAGASRVVITAPTYTEIDADQTAKCSGNISAIAKVNS